MGPKKVHLQRMGILAGWAFALLVASIGCSGGSVTQDGGWDGHIVDRELPMDGSRDVRPDRGLPDGEPAPNTKISRGGRFNGEPSIAINPTNPTNLVAAWMHSDQPRSLQIQTAFSTDGGRTWSEPQSHGHVAAAYAASADVSLVFDSRGTVHMTYIDLEPEEQPNPSCEFGMRSAEIVHKRSLDGGRTWSEPVTVRHSADSADFAVDRPWLAVDRSGGEKDGRLYLVTVSFFCNNPSPPQRVHLKWSDDGGRSWSEDLLVDNDEFSTGPYAGYPFPATIAVGGDGRVWITYPSIGSAACGGPSVVCLLSATTADGGATFVRSRIAAVVPAGSRGYRLFQTTAADAVRPGTGYVFWPDGRFDPAGSDILFSRSTDGGSSWSEPIRINDNPEGQGVGVDQPWAATGDNGIVAVIWRDRRGGGTGSDAPFEIYAAVSWNGGDSFPPNTKLSDQPSAPDNLPCCNSFEGLAIGGGGLHAVWGDGRELVWEIYTARLNLSP